LIGAFEGGAEPSDTSEEALVAALKACHLNDGTVNSRAEIRACTPAEETHKTTICHIPPGNPSNAMARTTADQRPAGDGNLARFFIVFSWLGCVREPRRANLAARS